MPKLKQTLILVGSAKHPKSTSESLGNYLQKRLEAQGVETYKLKLYQHVFQPSAREKMLEFMNDSDLWVLTFPLYIDSTPYIVVKWMEWVMENKQRIENLSEKKFLPIVNCGFPEAKHNEVAISICEEFAKEAGLEWLGGLSLGGGESIHGEPLDSKVGMVRHVTTALDLTAEAVADGLVVPDQAITLMAKSFIPKWVYTLVGEVGWRYRAKQNGMQNNLKDRPYDPTPEHKKKPR